ncbi:hypothetical protein [Halarcobacter sp.]|uniref:hypothetical protein n=1 Tax=Halarcobacter sp. TaxID=2321133 RepID=UPI003B00BAEB
MNTLKKLILSLLLVCSTSSFANTGGGGFDDPTEAFKFFIEIAEKARVYKDKHGHYSQEHINTLAPHVWANNKDYKGSAKTKLSNHRSYIISSKEGDHPFIVDLKYSKPFFNYGDKRKGIVTITYSYFKYQQKPPKDERVSKIRAKEVGNKIKWYIYR